ncbi:MAG: sigma-70 family RNA polymerase sigma factor [Lachnospiraceae bacterium]|nr:sigma-70 family RNA polymerase sigma factor [Lachnospiraceae bacterium]
MYFNRNESAIGETAKKYGKYCLTISENILRNREDAEESVNDAYMQTWNSIPPVKPSNLRAFLGKIVRNLSLNRLKAQRTKKRGSGEYDLAFEELEEVITSPQSVEELVEEISCRDFINKWLSTLTPEQRMVFVGRYWYFDSVSEISDKMNYSVSKTKMLLLRLRGELKEYLENEGIHI